MMTRARSFAVVLFVFSRLGPSGCKEEQNSEPPAVWECGLLENGGRCACAAVNRNTMLADDIPRLRPAQCPAEFAPCCFFVYAQCDCFSAAGLAARGQQCDQVPSGDVTFTSACPPP